MKLEDMRAALKTVYSGPSWIAQVDAYPPNQVMAVYKSFLSRNMFEKAKQARKMKEQGQQISIWEYLMREELKQNEEKCRK